MEFLKLIRIKDWLKNIIIFFPLIFSGYLFDLSNYSNLVIGFISFSIVSSIVYILNDILDIERDKVHPTKKYTKPLASGRISIKYANFLLITLIILSIILIFYQPHISIHLITYLLINLSYNFIFKKIPYLEFIILSLGYIIRIDTGSQIINVDSSLLMLVAIFLLGVYFILRKRISELNHKLELNNYKTRDVLKYYNLKILNYFSLTCIFALLVVSLIYVILIDFKLILSFLLMSVFLFKYNQLTSITSDGENPISLITSNRLLLFLSIIILASSTIIYIK